MSKTPVMKYFICAFIDLLGAKDKIFQESFIIGVAELHKLLLESPMYTQHVFHARVFSDNVVIACEVGDNINRAVHTVTSLSGSFIWEAFIRTKCLVRGGIAYDQLLIDGSVVIGPALSRAYDIESRQAIYPRIVIDEEIVQKLLGSKEPDQSSFYAHFHELGSMSRDFDGRVYVKPYHLFQRYYNSETADSHNIIQFNKYSAIFDEMVQEAKRNARILQKYAWWAKQMNKVFKEVGMTKRLRVLPLYDGVD